MQRGNVLTVYKNVSAIALGNTDNKCYRKRVKHILRFRKSPFQECTNMYPYVPLCTLLFWPLFVLPDLRPMQSRIILTERQNTHIIPTDYTGIKPYQKNASVFYASEKINTIQQYSALLNHSIFLDFDLIDLRSVQHNKILTEYKNVHPITSDYTSRKYQRKNTGTFAS